MPNSSGGTPSTRAQAWRLRRTMVTSCSFGDTTSPIGGSASGGIDASDCGNPGGGRSGCGTVGCGTSGWSTAAAGAAAGVIAAAGAAGSESGGSIRGILLAVLDHFDLGIGDNDGELIVAEV